MSKPTKLDEVVAQEAERIRADGKLVASFIQGTLLGTVFREGRSQIGVHIAEVETPQDSDGNYEDYFVVVTAAGHRIRVKVELE